MKGGGEARSLVLDMLSLNVKGLSRDIHCHTFKTAPAATFKKDSARARAKLGNQEGGC